MTYGIEDGNGNELSTGYSREIEVERAAQDAANRLGRSVYWYEDGEDGWQEEVDPDFSVEASVATRSETKGGMNVHLTLRLGERVIDGEAALRLDHRGWSSWGAPDNWLSSKIVEALRPLSPTAYRAVCTEIELAARVECEAAEQ